MAEMGCLPGNISRLSALTMLSLTGCQVIGISQGFSKLTALRTVRIIESSHAQQRRLEKSLSGPGMAALPPAFVRMAELGYCQVEDCSVPGYMHMPGGLFQVLPDLGEPTY